VTGHAVRLAAVVAALYVAAGCYWLRYYDLMKTHVDLMARLAADASAELAAAPDALQPADIERMRYPLQRARQFAAVVRQRYPDRVSLARFDALIDAYAELVTELDRARALDLGRDGRPARRRRPEARAEEATKRLAAEVAERAAQVRRAMAAEGG
jgi:hypothetical protein